MIFEPREAPGGPERFRGALGGSGRFPERLGKIKLNGKCDFEQPSMVLAVHTWENNTLEASKPL